MCTFPVPARTAEAYLTQAVAPWTCSTYLRVGVADTELFMPVEHASSVLSALFMLTAEGQAGEEAPR